MYEYGRCHVCDESLKEQCIKQELWVRGRLIVIEDVPAGVCPQCGAKVVKAEVGRSILKLVESSKRRRGVRTMVVPVLRLARKTA